MYFLSVKFASIMYVLYFHVNNNFQYIVFCLNFSSFSLTVNVWGSGVISRHEENKSKIGQERSSMQLADYHRHRPTPWMQESVSMHTPLRHSRMNQARSEEEEKERERERKDRGQEADGKKGNLTKTYQRNKRLISPLVLRYMNLSNFVSEVFFLIN